MSITTENRQQLISTDQELKVNNMVMVGAGKIAGVIGALIGLGRGFSDGSLSLPEVGNLVIFAVLGGAVGGILGLVGSMYVLSAVEKVVGPKKDSKDK